MSVATMNRINISLLFLIMISMILPASAFMYASGSTDNSEATSDGEFSENSFASIVGLLIIVRGHQIAGLPGITQTHHQIAGLLMIMLIYQQRQRKIIPLYQVNLR